MPESRQVVVERFLSMNTWVSLPALIPLIALNRLVDGLQGDEMYQKSGRRDSNPRQPAWKALCRTIAARFLSIGSRRALSNHHEIGSALWTVFQPHDGAVCACGSTCTVYFWFAYEASR